MIKKENTGAIEIVKTLSGLTDSLVVELGKLEELSLQAKKMDDVLKTAKFYAQKVIPQMQETRIVADKIESMLGEDYKPFPSYADLLFRI